MVTTPRSMTIKDRGQMKWVALMLPEHRLGLERLKREEEEIERPLLDEQQLERLDYILAESLREKKRIQILVYEEKKMVSIEGILRDYSPVKREIRLEGERSISLEAIMHIEILQ